jgi:acyl-CoA synthetase (AMP-forming)/AMP-acid ligase II
MLSLASSIAALDLGDEHVLAVANDKAFKVGDATRLECVPEVLPARAPVALCVGEGITFLRCLAALDGDADSLLLLAPTSPPAAVASLMAAAGSAVLVSDRPDLPGSVSPSTALRQGGAVTTGGRTTVWKMTTSGTTGTPKVIDHDLLTLTRSTKDPRPDEPHPRWGLLYEPSRFAGLQVVLQSLLGGGTLLLSDPALPLAERLAFFIRHGCSHLSATPTLWRKLLMMPASAQLQLRQVTLGGEIADNKVLAALAQRFPLARITHVYASTEAGVGFAVHDGRAGFPLEYLEGPVAGVEVKVVGEALWVRPPRLPQSTAGSETFVVDHGGYLFTGDRVQLHADRVEFLGRDSGWVNIGGTKVQVEQIERTVSQHADVGQCCVIVKKSPVTGSLLQLLIVPRDGHGDAATLKRSVRAWCASQLARAARPAIIKVVDDIPATAAGKVSREGT